MAVTCGGDGNGDRLGVVVVGGGSGTRFGDRDKVFAMLRSRPLILHSLDVFVPRPDVDSVVVVLASHSIDRGRELLATSYPDVIVREGGNTRAESVMAGLAALPEVITLVAIHDAARPLLTDALLNRVLAAARETGAAIPVMPVTDTIHEVTVDGTIASTPDRSCFRTAQTPQIARRDWLERAFAVGGPATDEAGRLAAAGFRVRVVPGEPDNVKVTWPADVAVAESLLSERHGGSS